MDSKTIETQDSLRYKLILIRTIGFFLCIGSVIMTGIIGLTKNMGIIITVLSIAALGGVVLGYSAIRLGLWFKKINKQPELKNALYNEMYQHYEYKAVSLGFYLMIASALFIGCSNSLKLTYNMACFTVLFIGVMATSIAQLIFHRK